MAFSVATSLATFTCIRSSLRVGLGNRQPTLFTEHRNSAHLKASLGGFRRFFSQERTYRNLRDPSRNCLDFRANPSTDPVLAAARRPRCPLFTNPKNRETCHGSIE